MSSSAGGGGGDGRFVDDDNSVGTSHLPLPPKYDTSGGRKDLHLQQQQAEEDEEPGSSRETVDKRYCASIRRVHRISPIFYKRPKEQEKQPKNKITIKTRSPIRISFRPNPGRTFDGFLDRFVKRN